MSRDTGKGDLAGHGGEQRAVFVKQIESYRHWREQLKTTDFVHGQLGENFTVEGLADNAVCTGDRYRIGTALFEVMQPRVTCYRIGIRMNEPRMPALLASSGRPGFLFLDTFLPPLSVAASTRLRTSGLYVRTVSCNFTSFRDNAVFHTAANRANGDDYRVEGYFLGRQ